MVRLQGVNVKMIWRSGFLTVFLVTCAAHLGAQDRGGFTETVLYNFGGLARGDGSYPGAGLVMDSAGNLYGTASAGGVAGRCNGSSGCGTVFKLDPMGNETVLYSFQGPSNGDGFNPRESLVIDSVGNLYGTTYYGGTGSCFEGFGCGTVFKVDPAGNETVLYNFQGPNYGDGSNPQAGLVMDSNGNLYGTTTSGGIGQCYGIGLGCGTVFRVDPAGNETVLYSFGGPVNGDGENPYGTLLLDNEGNFYGTTRIGGVGGCVSTFYGCGTVFRLDSMGTETVLYSFTQINGDGDFPVAGLTQDSDGNLYGTTSAGGSAGTCIGEGSGCGSVFKLDVAGNETVLHSFTGTNGDGILPYASLIIDSAGNLYGTTKGGGGAGQCYQGLGCGMVFELDPAGNEMVLHSFQGTDSDGSYLYGGLLMDTAGNLFGTASLGSISYSSYGTVFKLTAPQ